MLRRVYQSQSVEIRNLVEDLTNSPQRTEEEKNRHKHEIHDFLEFLTVNYTGNSRVNDGSGDLRRSIYLSSVIGLAYLQPSILEFLDNLRTHSMKPIILPFARPTTRHPLF